MTEFIFGAFRLDPAAGTLFRDNEPVRIGGQLWAVLICLVERPGELVTPDDLSAAAWPGAAATAETVKRTIRRLRSLLGDDQSPPLYIEAVHGRGYRFVATVTYASDSAEGAASGLLLGRDIELAALRRLLQQSGERSIRVALVTGDAGMGKTTLLDHFARDAERADVLLGRAACVDAAAEPYGALLSMLQDWLHAGDENLAATILRSAPTWAAELGLSSTGPDKRETGSIERMPREGLSLLTALARQRPVVLFIDDAHWADAGTVAMIEALGRRRDPVSLLVVCTARPHELSLPGCPAGALVAASADVTRVMPVTLSTLGEDAVTHLLHARGVAVADSERLRTVLHSLSGGHPLLATCLIEDWVARGVIDEIAAGRVVPDIASALTPSRAQTVAALVEQRLARLDPATCEALEAAALAGDHFDVREVSAAIGSELAGDVLFEIARRHFLIESGPVAAWPDGTTEHTYRFRHALLRAPLRDRVPPGRRQQWQRAFCERLEAGHAGDVSSVLHRLLGLARDLGDHGRTLRYEIEAARRAARRLSYEDAATHLELATAAASCLPASPQIAATVPLLMMRQAAALLFARGAGDVRIESLADRAAADAAAVGSWRTAFVAHLIRAGYLMRRARNPDCLPDCRRMIEIAESHTPTLLPSALCMQGVADSIRARFTEACVSFERARTLPGDPELPSDMNMERMLTTYHGLALGARGYEALSLRCFERSAAIAERDGNAMDRIELANYQCLRAVRVLDRQAAGQWSARMLDLDAEHGFPRFVTAATLFREWSKPRITVATAERMRGLQLQRRRGGEIFDDTLHGLMCADAFLRAGDIETALRINEEDIAAAQESEDFAFLSDQWRQHAEILLARNGAGNAREARSALRTAITLAREGDAACSELHSVRLLSRCGPLGGQEERWIAEATERADQRRDALEEVRPAGSQGAFGAA